jgi:2-iminobutanoate/2-iminopropanoate deaminase
MKPKPISTADAPAAIGAYSQGMALGGYVNLVFTSGQIALDLEGNMVGNGDIALETKQVLNNLNAVLHAAGSSKNCVIRATIYLMAMDDFPEVNEIYAAYFGEHKPARACVAVAALPKDARIEIDFVATKTFFGSLFPST